MSVGLHLLLLLLLLLLLFWAINRRGASAFNVWSLGGRWDG
jgi:hypothetical protein